MVIAVKGCRSCPFAKPFNVGYMSTGFRCSASKDLRIDVNQGVPEWCPLLEDAVTVVLLSKSKQTPGLV